MIKIALVMTSLKTGGIAISIANLLDEIAKNESYVIDLILFHSQPQDKEKIPDNVRILTPGKCAELIAISQNEAKMIGWRYSALRYMFGGLCKLFGHGVPYKTIFKHSASYKDYDVAISCSQSAPKHSLYGGCNEFVLNNIISKRKIAFIHCDYKTYGINDKYSHRIYQKFDKIAVVSDSVGNVFIEEEPLFRDKTFTVRNCNNITKIMQLSNEKVVEYSKHDFNIITVARFGNEKGHIRVLSGLKQLKDEGINFKWHLVGGDKEKAPAGFLERINEYDLSSQIVFHGIQQNPYRFMVRADCLLIPSFHEAAPMVFDEARLLHLPVITTKTVSAVEMVGKLNLGFVCENTDNGISEAICYFAKYRENLDHYRENSYHFTMDNSIALKQFKEVIGD